MVRRAEYALGKAIRAGQERGEIRRQGETGNRFDRWSGEAGHTLNSIKTSPTDFASPDELHNKTRTGIYDLVDDVHEDQFKEAITEARDEGNLSRANVVRKVQGVKSDKLTAGERLNNIGDMADTDPLGAGGDRPDARRVEAARS